MNERNNPLLNEIFTYLFPFCLYFCFSSTHFLKSSGMRLVNYQVLINTSSIMYY